MGFAMILREDEKGRQWDVLFFLFPFLGKNLDWELDWSSDRNLRKEEQGGSGLRAPKGRH